MSFHAMKSQQISYTLFNFRLFYFEIKCTIHDFHLCIQLPSLVVKDNISLTFIIKKVYRFLWLKIIPLHHFNLLLEL